MTDTDLTIDTWNHARTRTVEIPSTPGATVDVEPIDIPRSVQGGRIPTEDLRNMAIRVHYDPKFDPNEIDEAEQALFEDWIDWVVADRLRRPVVTPAFVSQVDDDEPHMPGIDRLYIYRVATHQDMGERLAMLSFRSLAGGPTDGPNGTGPRGPSKRGRRG